MRFKDIIRQEKTDDDVVLEPSETDLKSPFLRAVMRTHTKESEKFDVFRTELEITQRTCLELVASKTKLEVDIANMKEKEAQRCKFVAMNFASAESAIAAQFEATARFAVQSAFDAESKIQDVQNKVKLFYDQNRTLKNNLRDLQQDYGKSQVLVSDLANKLLLQNETEEKLRNLAKEHKETVKLLKAKESALATALVQVSVYSQKEIDMQQVLEGRLMATEEWRSIAVSLYATSQHNSAYTRFLEEQLLQSKKNGFRGNTPFSLRGHMHTPKSTISGVGGLDLSPSAGIGGWADDDSVLSLKAFPATKT